MQRVLIPLLTALLVGCANFQHMDEDQASRPERAMGTGARIMYPGQGGPSLGGPSGGGSGMGSSSSSSSDPELTMIGGNSVEVTGSQKVRQVPIIGPITALLGYPFWIFGKSVEEKAKDAAEKEKHRASGGSGPSGAQAVRTPDEAQRAQLRRENERIQQELLERSRAQAPAPSSLGDELAALERALGQASSSPEAAGARGGPLVPARDVADRNGDGNPDLWVYYDGQKRMREVLDEDYDGRADRVLHYQDGTALVRSEEDLDGDGQMETVSLYDAGQIVRKRTDSDGDGQSDSWSFYNGGELVRHEIDRNRDGFRDLVLIYAAGQLLREEEDRNGDGRPDLVTHYRNGEVTERHEDLDYDGTTDVASYYEDGKLVRRELTSEQVLDQWQPPRGS